MQRKSFSKTGITLLLVAMTASAWAAVPGVINYQGYLTDVDGDPVPDETYRMRFHFYDAETAGRELWNAPFGEEQMVDVTKGVYSVKLGLVEPFPADLFEDNPALYFEVEIQNSDLTWATLAPRQQFTSTPFAMKAAQADRVPDGAITSVMLDVDAITEENIADNAITISQITDGAVSPSKLGGAPGNGTYGQILQTDGDGTFSWRTIASADGHSLDAADGAPANVVYVHGNGNVGIGTTSPSSELEILGDLSLSGKVEDNDAGNTIDLDFVNNIKTSSRESVHIDIDTDNNATTEHFAVNSHNGASVLLKVQEDGNVGIGTFSPSEDLDIHPASGTAYLKVESEEANTGVIIKRAAGMNGLVAFRGDIMNDWWVGQLDPDNKDFSISKHVFVEPDGTFYLERDTGSLGIGTTNPRGQLDIRGDEVRIWDGSALVSYATGAGDLYVEDALEVDSDMYLDDRIIHGGDTNTYVDFNSDRIMAYVGGELLIDAYTLGSQDFASIGNTGDVDIYLNRDVFVQGSSGRVGIGTLDPSAKLHIKGGSWPDAFAYFDTDERGQDTGFRFYEDGNHKGGMYHNANNNSIDLVTMEGSTWHRLVMKSNGNLGIGTSNPAQKLDVNGTAQVKVLRITGGSDLSEPFDVKGTDVVEPGTVLVIDAEHAGKLKIAEKAYDRLVAGVVSGAGGVNPGLMMGQQGSVANGASPVALTGRIYCRADASNGSIEPGDLLTTSDTPGHAMKVTNVAQAQGAILGKAMSSLEDGLGLVLILVTLQ